MPDTKALVGYRTGEVKSLDLATIECMNCFPAFKDVLDKRETPAPINGLATIIEKYLPPLPFQPCHLMTDEGVVFSASFWQLGEEKPCTFVPWRWNRPDSENLWHFFHEIGEIFLKLKYGDRRLPRWLVEGVAQFVAYSLIKDEHPSLLHEAMEYYSNIPVADAELYFSWDYGSLRMNQKEGIEGALREILRWSRRDHSSEAEHACYRAALEAFVHAFSGKLTPRILIDLLGAQDGIDEIRTEVRKFFD